MLFDRIAAAGSSPRPQLNIGIHPGDAGGKLFWSESSILLFFRIIRPDRFLMIAGLAPSVIQSFFNGEFLMVCINQSGISQISVECLQDNR